MKKISLMFLLFGLFNYVSIAQNLNKDKLDNYFNVLDKNNKFMGSVCVSKGDKIIYSKSVGFINVANNLKANENSKYRIGSISKTFTAVLTLKAIEEAKLSLDQTIERYFPTIPNASKITIRHLLHHRSGIYNFTSDESYLTYNTQHKTEAEMIAIIAKADSNFEPGSKASYSNSNYVLLSYILEKIYKKPFREIVKNHIVQPLNLKNTFLGDKIDTKNNECQSYSYDSDWKIENETDISIPLGAGGIVSTPIDLTKFSNALFTGKLLKPESLNTMMTIEDNYGMGLFKFPFYNKVCYGHTGGIDKFNSVFSFINDEGISYALTSNGTNYDINNISIAVLSAVFDKPYVIPTFTSDETKIEDLDKYLGVYSSKQFPLKITIRKNGTTLFAQATGQPELSLEKVSQDIYKSVKAGAIFEFDLGNQTMMLKQGSEVLFTKE